MISIPRRRTTFFLSQRLLSISRSKQEEQEQDVQCAREHEDARALLERLDRESILPTSSTYGKLLQRCAREQSLEEGRLVHSHIVQTLKGRFDRYLCNLLIHMYARCGCIEEACLQYKQIHNRNEFTYSIMVAAFTHNGHYVEALATLQNMDLDGVPASVTTLTDCIKACSALGALSMGRTLHARLVERGQVDVVLMTSVLNMYAKCRRLDEARQVFDSIQDRDAVAWNAMVCAYVQNGHYREALEIYKQSSARPDRVTFITILRVCADAGNVEEGKRVHSRVIEMGMEAGDVGTMVVNMYAKCGCLLEAREVFDRMPDKYLVSWNVMIAAYAQQEQGLEALEIYEQMLSQKTLKPDVFTFSSVLSACCSAQSLVHGKMIHQHVIEAGCDEELGASLVNMYSKCASLEDAAEVFDKTTAKSLLAWTSIMSAYAQRGYSKEAVDLLWKMDLEGEKLDVVGYVCVLDACADLGDETRVEAIHKRIYEAGFESNLVVGLVDAYGKCGNIETARLLFDGIKQQERTLPLWNAMLGACLGHELLDEMISLFGRMVLDGVKGDRITFILLLEGFSDLLPSSRSLPPMAKSLVQAAVESGYSGNIMVGTGLVGLLSTYGDPARARNIFDALEFRDVVSWNAMSTGYALQNDLSRIVELYHIMLQEGIKPDELTFIRLVEPCMADSGLAKVKELHQQIVESGYGSNSYILTVLLEAYGKCGSFKLARDIFSGIQVKDVVTWSTVLGIYAGHGQGKQALEVFCQMNLEGVHPNEYTFLGILVACSHSGLQHRAKHYVESMVLDFGILPIAYHYGSLVDLLGRAARVDEAAELATSLPDPLGWSSTRVQELQGCWLMERVRGKELALSFE